MRGDCVHWVPSQMPVPPEGAHQRARPRSTSLPFLWVPPGRAAVRGWGVRAAAWWARASSVSGVGTVLRTVGSVSETGRPGRARTLCAPRTLLSRLRPSASWFSSCLELVPVVPLPFMTHRSALAARHWPCGDVAVTARAAQQGLFLHVQERELPLQLGFVLLWGGSQISLEISSRSKLCLFRRESPCTAVRLTLPAVCPSVRRKPAGACRPAGAQCRGAGPDPPPGGGGPGVRERVAGPGQCVLTRPTPATAAVSEVECCGDQSTWNFFSEASGVKKCCHASWLAIKLSQESLSSETDRNN